MSYKRKPIYQFKDTAEMGSDKIPLNRIVYVESENNIYKKDNNVGLTGSSTITDAIIGNNLILISGGSSDGISQTEYDSSFLYDATNMNDIICEVNTDISATPSLVSTIKDTTDRIDATFTSTTTEIYLDNKVVDAEVGETITTDQGDLVIKEVNDDGSYDYDDIGYNGFGNFNAPDNFMRVIPAGVDDSVPFDQLGMWLRVEDGKIYAKNNNIMYTKQTGVGESLDSDYLGLPYSSGFENINTDGWDYTGVDDVYALYYSAGNGSFFYIRKSDLRLFACGENDNGQLGLGSTSNELSWTDTGLTNVVKVCSPYGTTVVLKNDGTVWGSGLNSSGEFGDGTTTDSTTFVQTLAVNAVDIYVCLGVDYIDSSGEYWRYHSSGTQNADGRTDALRHAILAPEKSRVLPSGQVSYWVNTAGQLQVNTGAPKPVDNIKKIIFGKTPNMALILKNDSTLIRYSADIASNSGLELTVKDVENVIVTEIYLFNDSGSYDDVNMTFCIIRDGKMYETKYSLSAPPIRGWTNTAGKAAERFSPALDSGLVLVPEYTTNNSPKYKTKYWVVPETPLAAAPSTAYLNTHRAKSPYAYQDNHDSSFCEIKNMKVIIAKEDFIDTGKTSTLTKVFFDASTEVRVNEEFCSQTGEVFVLQDIQTDGTGYWGTPTTLTTAPTAVYGLSSIKINDALAPQGTATIGVSVTQNFNNVTIGQNRKYRLNIHPTDSLDISEISGDVYRVI